MAYSVKFYINWKARTGELFTFNILQKDFVGSPAELTATDKPFTLQKQEENPLAPIQATLAQVQYYNDAGTPLKTFFSNDDEMYRGDFLKRDGTLLWTGYLVQDDCEEPLTAAAYAVTLKFTDNLGLLKDLRFDAAAALTYTDSRTVSGTVFGTALTIERFNYDPFLNANEKIFIYGTSYLIASYYWVFSVNTLYITLQSAPANGVYDCDIRINENLLGKHSLFSYLRIGLTATGLALPLNIYANIFDTDHDDSAGKECLSQTRLYSGKYVDEKSIWTDIYSILTDILTDLQMQLFQAGGAWVVIRKTELVRFADNAVMGVGYDSLFENPQAITLAPNYGTISVENDAAFIGANAISKITRPYNYVKETFNYSQPQQLIKYSDLLHPGAFVSTSTVTIHGKLYRLDRYQIPAVWRHENSDPNDVTYDASYIIVKTDIANDVIVDRYIYQPFIDHAYKYLQFNPIEVNEGDKIDFSLSLLFQTHDGTDTTDFKVRFLLITPAGDMYNLINYNPGGGANPYLRWNSVSTNPATTDATWRIQIGVSITVSQDLVNSQSFTLSSIGLDKNRPQVPGFPEDGILLISISGVTNPGGAFPAADVSFKEIQLTVTDFINESTKVIGHVHNQQTTNGTKNKYDETIVIDDSPKNLIQGTLFTNTASTFIADIGDVYFTRSSAWNLRFLAKTQKLGQYITNERQGLYSEARTRIEGSFLFADSSLDATKVFTLAGVPGIQFIFGNIQEIDFMQMQATGELLEIHKDPEDIYSASEYTFKYLYDTN